MTALQQTKLANLVSDFKKIEFFGGAQFAHDAKSVYISVPIEFEKGNKRYITVSLSMDVIDTRMAAFIAAARILRQMFEQAFASELFVVFTGEGNVWGVLFNSIHLEMKCYFSKSGKSVLMDVQFPNGNMLRLRSFKHYTLLVKARRILESRRISQI